MHAEQQKALLKDDTADLSAGQVHLKQRISSSVGKALDRLCPVFSRRLRIALGLCDATSAERIRELEQRTAQLQHMLDLVAQNADLAWLYRNKYERMDATVPDLFDPLRSQFHLARYEFAAQRVRDENVVDIACGTGYGSSFLRRHGAKSVVGVDIDPEAVSYATRRFAEENVSFVVASGDATPLADASADVIVSFETIEHVPDDDSFLREIHRILRPGGTFICSTPNEWPLEIAPYHTREYSRQGFEAAVSKFFKVEEMWNQNSGSPSKYNHDQPAGMQLTTAANEHLAECFVCVARKLVSETPFGVG